MRKIFLTVIFVATITVFVFVNAYPIDDKKDVGQNTLSDVYDITPDETQDSVQYFILPGETTVGRRVKRADIMDYIRQICPPLYNFLNNIYQRVKKVAFQVIGKLLLGGGNKNKNGGGEEKPAVIVELPSYSPGDDEDTITTEQGSSSSTDSNGDSDTSSSADNSSSSTEESSSSDTSSSQSSSSPSETTLPAPNTTTESRSLPPANTNSISTK